MSADNDRQGVITDPQGRIVRNLGQGAEREPGPPPQITEEPAMAKSTKAPGQVTITHTDGRTATVGPKVAAVLERNEGWTIEGKPDAEAPTGDTPDAPEPGPEDPAAPAIAPMTKAPRPKG